MNRRQYQREWTRRKFGYNPRKVIAQDDRRAIKALCDEGVTHKLIANVYGVSARSVDAIARGVR